MSTKKYKQEILRVSQLVNPEKYCGKSKEIYIRSSWEKSFLNFISKNPNILKWSSEDIVINYKMPTENRQRRYFPDFYLEVKTKNGIKKIIVEIKPYAETIKPVIKPHAKTKTKEYLMETYVKNDSKWKYARAWCRERGYSFIILTEKDILFSKLSR